MQAKITIPRSIKGVTDALEGIGQLVTAKEWERAALVYAVTTPGTGGPRELSKSGQLSFREFTELEIHGLRSTSSVAKYHEAWQIAVDEGYAKPSGLRRTMKLPDSEEHPFPPTKPEPPDAFTETAADRGQVGRPTASRSEPESPDQFVERDAGPDPLGAPVNLSVDWSYEGTRLADRINGCVRDYEAVRMRFTDNPAALAVIAHRIEEEVNELSRTMQGDLLLSAEA